jgi:hypothetical protein
MTLPADLSRWVGSVAQLAGIELYEALDGPERGVRKARVRSGAGLEFTVNIDRGFDIGEASLHGINVTWRSSAGAAHPYAHQHDAVGWLKRFPGGLVTTCGLDNVGPVSSGRPLHGTHSERPARLLCCQTLEQEGAWLLTLCGEVTSYQLFGPHIVLTRRICCELGRNRLWLYDTITNRGFTPTPILLLYHCNFGYPLLSEASRLELESSVIPRDDAAAKGLARWNAFHPPQAGYAEQVFLHDATPGADGQVTLTLANPERQLAVTLSYDKATLPCLSQWKQLGEGAYVLGLEPGTCYPLGFEAEQAAGRVVMLAPQAQQHFRLTFDFQGGHP